MSEKKSYYQAYDERYKQVHQEGIQWFSDAPSKIVEQTIKQYHIPKQADILEIGCGEGRDAENLLNKGYHLLATDISAEAIGYCKEKFPQFQHNFCTLDCLNDTMQQKFDFIYAVAVLHMFVLDEDRQKFYQFIGSHLKESGVALIGTMGDGSFESCSNPDDAFALQSRTHEQTGKEMMLASTSCRVVNFTTFHDEIQKAGLELLESGMTCVPPDFPVMMVAVVKGRRD